MPHDDFVAQGAQLGRLVEEKQRQYGNAVSKSGRILAVLYPDGIAPHQYADAALVVRALDKLSRVAQRGRDGVDLGGESPWGDIAGYGLLGARQDAERGPVPGVVTPGCVTQTSAFRAICDALKVATEEGVGGRRLIIGRAELRELNEAPGATVVTPRSDGYVGEILGVPTYSHPESQGVVCEPSP